MPLPRVFVTRKIPETGLVLLRDTCVLDVWPGELPPGNDEMLKHIAGVDGLLCLLTDRVDRTVIEAAGPNLKVISIYAVGFDNIDINFASQRGIRVGNTPGILTEATADLAFALLMAAARRLVEGDRYVRAGKWKTWGPTLLLGVDIHASTLGIIGYGRIGQAMARRAAGFGMRILYYDPNVGEVDPSLAAQSSSLDFLLRESDFISLHTPLTPETRHIMDSAAIAKMKPSAVLINTARGAVVDPDALYHALKEKRIFAAALDVTEPEPIPLNSPLFELDNLIILPHIASASRSTRERMAVMAAENLLAGLHGLPLPNCVNPPENH